MSGINGAPSIHARREANRKARWFKNQDGKCWICGEPMSLRGNGKARDPLRATWDHLLPKSMGGTRRASNLKLAHGSCNVRRGNQDASSHQEPVDHG